MPNADAWRPLAAVQTCFVVADVDSAVCRCERDYGWGPFVRFSAPSPGDAVTHVALGNAGRTQVELISTEKVRNTVSEYQQRYGVGFQHLGVVCRDVDRGLEALEGFGGKTRERGSYPGVRFAFVDVPTGPGMLELLQPDANVPAPPAPEPAAPREVLPVESAMIVTSDLDGALAFFEPAFGWESTPPVEDVLEIEGEQVGTLRRVGHRSGTLRLELVEPVSGDNLYSRHLAQRDHGLVHVGVAERPSDEARPVTSRGRWLRSGERFGFLESPFGAPGIRVDETG